MLLLSIVIIIIIIIIEVSHSHICGAVKQAPVNQKENNYKKRFSRIYRNESK